MGGESSEGDILLKKMNKDAAAMIRSIAERRNRNEEACEKAVSQSDAFTDQYALENGLIDLTASSREELLELLNGREVRRFDGAVEVLTLSDPTFIQSEYSMKQAIMEFLSSPIVAYALLLLGLAGIYIEFTHPGLIVPGVLGGLFLVLFAISASVLPISMLGLALIALAVVLFVLEVKIVSYGLLTLGGVVCLVFGSAFLVDGPVPELRIPYTVILPMSLTMALLVGVAVFMTRQAMRTKVRTGVEGLVGESGVVSEALAPEGKIQAHGEIWNSVSLAGDLAVGTRVSIVRVDEMTLFVEPLKGEHPRGTSQEV
jgi:membrane-bound serine protease (ClpP class)